MRRLLHDEGYTIKGVQKLHRELGGRRFAAGDAAERPPDPDAPAPDAPPGPLVLDDEARQRLAAALEALEAAKTRLDALLGGD